MSWFVTVSNAWEKTMLQKFTLLLNSKKDKIWQLKEEKKLNPVDLEDSDEEIKWINEMSKEQQERAVNVIEDSFIFDTQLLGTGALDELHTKSIF